MPKVNKTVAVMQPYFFPYGGYYRLFALADHFVILDSVQFPRRGRVHRSPVPGADGQPAWLTLPLARQARDTRIRDLAFSADARERLTGRLPAGWRASSGQSRCQAEISSHLFGPLGGVSAFLEDGLRLMVRHLGLEVEISSSSELALDPDLHGAARVREIVRLVGGDHYISASGGRHLYDGESFALEGLSLSFLEPYEGSVSYMLPALFDGRIEQVRDDILRHSRFYSV